MTDLKFKNFDVYIDGESEPNVVSVDLERSEALVSVAPGRGFTRYGKIHLTEPGHPDRIIR